MSSEKEDPNVNEVSVNTVIEYTVVESGGDDDENNSNSVNNNQ